MTPIEKLAELFLRFPGIGKRQARRFVYFLLGQPEETRTSLAQAIENLNKEIVSCASCRRFFIGKETQKELCDLCGNGSRAQDVLIVVEKDIDLENIEQSGAYTGRYFVLGGTVPVLGEPKDNELRTKELLELTQNLKPKEIIIALAATPEGEHTANFVRETLSPLQKKLKFKISALGRGLSTGTELEYSDADTIKNALSNRG